MKIQILCDNPSSWVIPYAKDIASSLSAMGHAVTLLHEADQIEKGDILILLSCEKLFKQLSLNKHNLVVHGSALPQGKGWSPLTWMVLENKNKLPVTLFEAVEDVDAGPIYGQLFFDLDGTELIDELREKQFMATKKLLEQFVAVYPDIVGVEQTGESTYYPKRKPQDSKLDIEKSLDTQFNLLRVCDNERYPAYFEKNGVKYMLKIYKTE